MMVMMDYHVEDIMDTTLLDGEDHIPPRDDN